MGSPGATILTLRVVCVQYISDPRGPGASGLGCLAILIETLTDLIALDPKEDPSAQAVVPCDDLASYLYIISYLASTDFM